MPAQKDKIRILFLCTGNSCRSQMAEGWARYLKGSIIEPHSAGVEVHGLDSRAVRVMAEAGVGISGQYSKHVDEVQDAGFDYVVTVCDSARERCPVFPGSGDQHIFLQNRRVEAELNFYDNCRDDGEDGYNEQARYRLPTADVVVAPNHIRLSVCRVI